MRATAKIERDFRFHSLHRLHDFVSKNKLTNLEKIELFDTNSNLLDSMNNFIDLEIKLGFIGEDLCPLICTNCGSEDFKRTDHYSDHCLEEIDVHCTSCKKQVGCCSYAYWTVKLHILLVLFSELL